MTSQVMADMRRAAGSFRRPFHWGAAAGGSDKPLQSRRDVRSVRGRVSAGALPTLPRIRTRSRSRSRRAG